MTDKIGNINQVLEVISELEEQKTVDDTFRVFRTFTKAFDATSLLIGKLVNPILEGQKISAFGIADWHPEWQKKWIEGNYVIHDPVSQYAVKTRSTFEWKTAYGYATEFGKRILEEGQRYTSDNGLAIPITVGHLPLGVVSIGFDKALPRPDDIARLELTSIHCYSHILRLLDIGESLPEIKLTKRETDVLNYVAAGKTNWEVSKIFGISEHSVAQHMKNISRKMNASNRAHAVTLGIKSGQIIA